MADAENPTETKTDDAVTDTDAVGGNDSNEEAGVNTDTADALSNGQLSINDTFKASMKLWFDFKGIPVDSPHSALYLYSIITGIPLL